MKRADVNDQLLAAHQERARLVARLLDVDGKSVMDVVDLLQLSASRVAILADLGRSQLLNPTTPEETP